MLVNRILLAVVFGCLLILGGCTPSLKHSILSTLFDDVPPLDTTTFVAKIDTIALGIDSSALESSQSEFVKKNHLHPPFQQRKCHMCHEDFSKKFVMPLPDLCFQCHEPFWNKYEKLHGPVISGHCVKCHNPHYTDKPRMLKRAGQDICLECHTKDAIFANSKHDVIGNRNCTDCHSPHGGENNFMLKPGSCYNCHDIKMQEPGGFKHGPVASDNCYQCHGTHSTKADHKLLRKGQDICLKCHDREDIMKNNVHTQIGNLMCTICHSPHRSEKRYLILH